MTANEILDEIGIQAICDRIADSESQADIAKSLGMSPSRLSEWLASDMERSACAREARAASAYKCDDLALRALEEIPDDASNAIVSRQREIASHHRWRAKTRNPKFSDKVAIGGADDLPPVKTETSLNVSGLSTQALAEIMALNDANNKE